MMVSGACAAEDLEWFYQICNSCCSLCCIIFLQFLTLNESLCLLTRPKISIYIIVL